MEKPQDMMLVEHHDKSSTPPVGEVASEHGADNFKFTFGKLLAIISFQLGYMADVWVLIGASTLISDINRSIGPSTDIVWIATGQILPVAILAPMTGRLSDIFGRRNFLIAGNIISIVGCAVCATANNVNTVIGGSVLIGIASSMHQLAWSCLGELVPKESRALALGLFQMSLVPAGAFGPLVAYSFVSNGSWRPTYWLPFALNVLALILVFLFYHPVNQFIREQGKTTFDQIKETDFVGCAIWLCGLVLFLLGITFGGQRYPWTNAVPIALICCGAAALVALGFWEAKANLKYPMFPKVLFKQVRTFTVILVAVLLLGMLYYSTTILFVQQVSLLYSQDPIKIGLYASALGLGGSLLSPPGGWALKRFKHANIQLPLYVFFATVVSGAQAIVSPSSNVSSTLLVVLIGGFIGSITVVTAGLIQISVDHDYIGAATGLVICARSVGGTLATTIYSAVLNQEFTGGITKYIATPLAQAGVPPTELPAIIEALLTGQQTSPALASLSPAELQIAGAGIQNNYAHAFRIVYLIGIAFGGCCFIASLFTKNTDHLMTKKVEMILDEGALKEVMDLDWIN